MCDNNRLIVNAILMNNLPYIINNPVSIIKKSKKRLSVNP